MAGNFLSEASKANEQISAAKARRAKTRRWLLWGVPGLAVITGLVPLLQWQKMGQQRASSLANLRRVAMGFSMYAEDWDGRGTPVATRKNGGLWRTWPVLLRAYVTPDSTFSNPANPVVPFHSNIFDPQHRYPIDSSYALNARFWNTFSPGPFPLDNLELPAQTVLLVEAGPIQRDPLYVSRDSSLNNRIAEIDYKDVSDQLNGCFPYPSTHDRRMAVVAADGHELLIKVVHYYDKDGAHDAQYGRLGENIYNWNGGHPNGETDRPAHE